MSATTQPSGTPATARAAFDGAAAPLHSATTVSAVGSAPHTSSIRGVIMNTRARIRAVSAAIDPAAAPPYMPRHRAQTGSCAAKRWNERSGR